MPTTYAQWGATINQNGVYFWPCHPLPEAPEEYNDATDKVRQKFRLRFFLTAPAGGLTITSKLCSTGALNLVHELDTITTAWSSTWAAAEEQIGYPEGYAQDIEDMNATISPHHYPGRIYAESDTAATGIIYGLNVGPANDDAYGSDPEWDDTPRSGQTLYEDYYPACSWLISDELICGLNKIVESARWRISAPVMGER